MYKRQINPTRVHYAAFMPNPDDNNRSSVYRIEDLTPNEIWSIGDEYVAGPDREIKGYGLFFPSESSECELEIIPELTPHPRHANIDNWKSEESGQKLQAIALAKKARPVLKP